MRRIGVIGDVVDLAIVHPTQPGRYILDVECDGVTYQARDGDRLR